jgi:hypothetical protein
MWRSTLVLTALVAALPAAAQDFPGRMQCEALAVVSPRPLDQRITLTIQGGVLRYTRNILNAQGQQVGTQETGEGRIGPDGAVTVTGSGTTGATTFSTRLSGRVAPDGTVALSGTQTWLLRGGGSTRACTITGRRG